MWRANCRTNLSISTETDGRPGLAFRRWEKSHLLATRSEEHTSELQSPCNLVCRLLLEKNNRFITCPVKTDAPSNDAGGTGVMRLDVKEGYVYHMGELEFRCFFFNDTATTEIYTLSLHDALLI